MVLADRRLRPVKYRSIFISDTHLGFRGCQAEFLSSFLNSTQSDYLYLIGDILDGWEMRKKVYWPQSHQEVVNTILQKAASGTMVVYTPGNHDEVARSYCDQSFDNIHVRHTAIHETAGNRRLLILHGDQFDTVIKVSPLLARLGSTMYDKLLRLNRLVNFFRKLFGKPYWSLAAHLKNKVKNVVSYMSRFEEAVVNSARAQNLDGVVCGHIHHAEITHYDDILYCNTGDWVESCTALVERQDGSLEIIRWTEQAQTVRSLPVAVPEPELALNKVSARGSSTSWG
ncbi:MAG: UDP-2,3-diacylglucosamine diphosphatase [Pseudomonadales bacterium]|nr:UDP-2,3-diacylglucosamine diphosphatase [Pseudomonadales bacterium]